jgi:hypothetical protein
MGSREAKEDLVTEDGAWEGCLSVCKSARES